MTDTPVTDVATPPAPPEPTFFEQLAARCQALGGGLCVGLDPDPKRLPRHLGEGAAAVYHFCVEIIEATGEFAAAYKPNIAFFESMGAEGLHALKQVLAAVPKEIPVIVDAKRGDIGSTARHYAEALYDDLGAGAVTLNPYMGRDSLEPFIERKTRGAYILCLTSNEGARDFQLQDDLYLRVARKVHEWNTHANLGMVVGATKPQYLTSILAVAPNVPLLIPGLGAQGGELEAIVAAAPGVPPHHLLFNVSRSILYAGEGKAFAQQARVAARVYADQIREALAKNAG